MDRELYKLHSEFSGISVIEPHLVPTDKRKCPYLNPVIRVKRDLITNEIVDHRTRLTWGLQARPEDPTVNSSSVIASPAVKLLFNSVVSDPYAQLSTIDLNYFYYQSRIPTDYCRLLVRYIPPASRRLLNIEHLPDSATIYLAVTIAIPGRPDAGKIAQDSLIAHLAKHNYIPVRHTPCLFRHKSKPIFFATHVDDFAIKSDKRTTDLHDLTSALKLKYQLKLTENAVSFLGAAIRLSRHPTDHSRDELGVSMPNFVRAALTELKFTPTYNPSSPMLYTGPTYTKADMDEPIDNSPLASIADGAKLRKSVGSFRWYAPAVDPILVTPCSRLANQQSTPTQNTMEQLDRFHNYAYHHPNAELIYTPSNMVMWIHSDASHHSEPGSRSRAGGFFVCGEPIFNGPDAPFKVNAPFDIISTKLPTVTGSSSESETGALYINATTACTHRITLEDLGHPQPPTPIVYDNQVSGKVALGKAKQKKSKAFATRYHWLKDRLRLGEFRLVWAPGSTNLADFFTKVHPGHHVRAMRPVYVRDKLTPKSDLSSRKPRSSNPATIKQ
jgi:hypothetical protein